MSNRWDERADRTAERFYRNPIKSTAGYGCLIAVVIAVIIVIGGAVGFASGWFNGARETVGFDNSKTQVTAVIGDEKEMIATAGNVCDIQTSKSHSDGDPQLVEDPAFAYRATYRNIKADYDRRMANLYEAKIVVHFGASSLPKEAPTLNERLAEVCDAAE